MARKNNLSAERNAVRRKIRNAQAKQRRLERQGITDLGRYDPFRAVSVDRYNRAQLAAYGRALDKFTNRNAQFVPGVNGEAMAKGLYERYERLARARQANARDFNRSVDNMVVSPDGKPTGNNVTIGEQRDYLRPDNPERLNTSSHDYEFMEPRRSTQIEGEKALRKYIKSLTTQVRAGHVKTTLKHGEPLMVAALSDAVGSDGVPLIDRYNRLTPKQRAALWNIQSFTDQASVKSAIDSLLMDPDQEVFSEDTLRANRATADVELEGYIRSVESPTYRNPKPSRRGKKKR